MFKVEGNKITLSRGDTGTVTIGVTGYSFLTTDRVVFAVRKAGSADLIMRRELPVENGTVTVEFKNSDTDSLPSGNYEWDVRFVMNPIYGETGTEYAGQIIDGDEINTPELPMQLELLPTVGQI